MTTLAKLLVALGWPENITVDDAKATRRQLLSPLHPDRGGDAGAFYKVKDLCDQAIAKLQVRADVCPLCNGTGSIQAKGGFGGLSQVCPCKLKKK